MKILHVFNHGLPEVDGYSIRSYNMLLHQRKLGLHVLALTSPKQGKVADGVDEIGGIQFHRTNYQEPKAGLTARPFVKEGLLMIHLYRRIVEIARQQKVDLIHAHSPSLNGLPAYGVARRLKIPVVYEMRSLWEEGPPDQRRSPAESLRFAASYWIETQLLRRVDAVAVISQGLRQDLISRGVDGGKVAVFPNGVDVGRFVPVCVNERLRCKLGLTGRFIVGFVGTFNYWEGLDLLVQAAAEVVKHDCSIHVLFVGSDESGRLNALARSLGMEEFVTFTGRVPPENILDYYSIIDLFVYPRKRMRLTEVVTPLKPLEAMAMGKLVLASDVGGHKELISDAVTGYLFEADNVADLARKIVVIKTNSNQLDAVRQAARRLVSEQRNWHDIATRYADFYDRVFSLRCRLN